MWPEIAQNSLNNKTHWADYLELTLDNVYESDCLNRV